MKSKCMSHHRTIYSFHPTETEQILQRIFYVCLDMYWSLEAKHIVLKIHRRLVRKPNTSTFLMEIFPGTRNLQGRVGCH